MTVDLSCLEEARQVTQRFHQGIAAEQDPAAVSWCDVPSEKALGLKVQGQFGRTMIKWWLYPSGSPSVPTLSQRLRPATLSRKCSPLPHTQSPCRQGFVFKKCFDVFLMAGRSPHTHRHTQSRVVGCLLGAPVRQITGAHWLEVCVHRDTELKLMNRVTLARDFPIVINTLVRTTSTTTPRSCELGVSEPPAPSVACGGARRCLVCWFRVCVFRGFGKCTAS